MVRIEYVKFKAEKTLAELKDELEKDINLGLSEAILDTLCAISIKSIKDIEEIKQCLNKTVPDAGGRKSFINPLKEEGQEDE